MSQISGKLKLNFSANALFSAGVSKDTPTTAAPFLSYSALRSRNPQPSAVQPGVSRSEEHTSELQSRLHLVCRLLLEKKKKHNRSRHHHPQSSHYTSSSNRPIADTTPSRVVTDTNLLLSYSSLTRCIYSTIFSSERCD